MATKDIFRAENDQRVPDHPCKEDSTVSRSSKECFARSALQQQVGCSSGDINALRSNTNLSSRTEGAYGVPMIGRGNVVSTTTGTSVAPMVQELDTVSPSPVEVDDDAAAGFSTFCSLEETSKTSSLDQEIRRLQVLKGYLGVLDGVHSSSLERIPSLARRMCRTPIALVAIADLDKQYVVSCIGWKLSSTVKSPFCSHAVASDCDLLVVRDATKDSRFQNDPHVTGEPRIRFYAGAPLISREGHKLGTVCVMDTEPRVEVSLDEKLGLKELAAMAMDILVDLRDKVNPSLEDPSQLIACTAHDLLTPLTGIALSLSLLKDDEALQRKLNEQQMDMIDTAAKCSSVMNSICQRTMEGFRDQGRVRGPPTSSQAKPVDGNKKNGPCVVRVSDLVKNLDMVMEPFPKQVPLIIKVDPAVPAEFISDDVKIFRSATNYLTNACAKTESGSIELKIFVRKDPKQVQEIIFECQDTGPGVDVAKYPYLFKPVREEADPLRVSRSQSILHDVPAGGCRAAVQNTGLGLYSVATQICSIGGKFGFRPLGADKGNVTGSVFWFSVPLILPQANISQEASSVKKTLRSDKQILGCEVAALRKPLTRAIEHEQELGKIEDGTGTRCRMLAASTSSEFLPMYEGPKMTMQPEDKISGDQIKPRKRLHGSSTGRKNSALVIEDSLVVRKSIARALSKLGFEVTQASNGMEGLLALQRSLYDMVLCDFLMPVMDGLDCIQQYRQWERANRPYFSQYVVGISAHASDRDVQQGYIVGMNDFRPKPITYKGLTDLMNGKEFSRTKLELDKLGHDVDSVKRRKLPSSPESNICTLDDRVCLVIEGSTIISKATEMAAENGGWKIVSVNDRESALRLLRLRNWDAVLLDEELSKSRFMTTFREWEKTHRVKRQNNVVLISSNFVGSHEKAPSSFLLPTGFDGVLGKPLHLELLQVFLSKAAEKSTCLPCDILTR